MHGHRDLRQQNKKQLKTLPIERMVLMKKKRSLVLLVVILLLSLVLSACRATEPDRPSAGTPGENPVAEEPSAPETPNVPQTPEAPGNPGRITDEIVRIMTSNRYTMMTKTYVEILGREFEVESTLAKNGDVAAMETDFGGMNTSLVMKEEKLYIISHDRRQILVVKGSDLSNVPGGQNPDIRLEGIEYAGSGTGEFRGQTYSYEEYTVEKGRIRFYFNDSRVVGMEYTMDRVEAQMEILSLEESVDDSMFEIPSDYQVTDTTRP